MELTKEVKQSLILSLLGLDEPISLSAGGIERGMIGKICMFRTYSAGVHFGELVEKDGQDCLVKDARRVFYWTQACSLSQLAMDGSQNSKDCKISVPVDEIILEQVIEIIPMRDIAIKNLTEHVWKK